VAGLAPFFVVLKGIGMKIMIKKNARPFFPFQTVRGINMNDIRPERFSAIIVPFVTVAPARAESNEYTHDDQNRTPSNHSSLLEANQAHNKMYSMGNPESRAGLRHMCFSFQPILKNG
jgi:cell division protein FtsN